MTTTHSPNICLLRSIILACVAAAAVLPFAGCSLYSDPGIQVTGITMTEQSDEAMSLNVSMELANENNVPLELLDFDYTFAVDGRTVFRGRRSAEATLSARGSHAVTIPVVVPYHLVDWRDDLPAEFDYSLRGSIRYVTPGQLAELLLDLGVRRPRAGFASDGRVSIRPTGTSPAGTSG